jgi:hypothetical protein
MESRNKHLSNCGEWGGPSIPFTPITIPERYSLSYYFYPKVEMSNDATIIRNDFNELPNAGICNYDVSMLELYPAIQLSDGQIFHLSLTFKRRNNSELPSVGSPCHIVSDHEFRCKFKIEKSLAADKDIFWTTIYYADDLKKIIKQGMDILVEVE